MLTYHELARHAESLAASYRRSQIELKATLVGRPLYAVSEAFKWVFLKVLGFEWFLDFSLKFNLPSITLSLPIVRYALGYASDLVLGQGGHFAYFFVSNPLISQFSIGFLTYKLNPINWWAIPVNYIARNLGKFIGVATIVSPFTIPANLVIKAYYGIKRAILNFTINTGLKNLEPQDLAKSWLMHFSYLYSDHMGVSRIAQYVNANDMFIGLVAAHSDQLSNAMEKGEYGGTSLIEEHCYHAYCEAREKALVSERRWSLAKTILSGILLIPLFLTIPAHKHLVLRHKEERALLGQNAAILKELIAKQNNKDGVDESSLRYNFPSAYSQADSRLYFEFGKMMHERRRPDLAFSYFSKVPESSVHYGKAMRECGSLQLLRGEYQSAAEYFLKVGDVRASRLAGRLAIQPDALLSELMTESSESKEQPALVLPAPVSPGRSLSSAGVFAQPPSARVMRLVDPSLIRGLDEDEDTLRVAGRGADQTRRV